MTQLPENLRIAEISYRLCKITLLNLIFLIKYGIVLVKIKINVEWRSVHCQLFLLLCVAYCNRTVSLILNIELMLWKHDLISF
jgi:hypothetical protein